MAVLWVCVFARHIRWASKVSKARRGQQVSKLARGHLVLGTSKVDAVSTLFWYNHATFIGVCLSEPHTIGNTSIDRLTMSVPFTWYWYNAHAHAATPYRAHVRGGEQCGDSYKTKNANSRKAKSWDTHAMNCEAGTRERPVNLSILVFSCKPELCCGMAWRGMLSERVGSMHTCMHYMCKSLTRECGVHVLCFM